MNDLIYASGEHERHVSYKDLGLPTLNNVNTKWPTPEKIKLNSKRETVPVTFRVDEVAYTTINLFAQQCEMSINSFLNELVNSYINENKGDIDGMVFKSTVNLGIERLALKLQKMSQCQIIEQYHGGEIRSIIEYVTNQKVLGNEESLYSANTIRELLDVAPYQFFQHSYFNCCYQVTKSDKSTIEDYREESLDSQATVLFSDYCILVPVEKWIYLKPLLDLFKLKCCIFLEKDEAQNNLDYKELVEIINKYNRIELINKVSEWMKFKEKTSWMKILQK